MYLRMHVLPCMHTHYNTNLKQTQESRIYMCVHSQGPPTHHLPTHAQTHHTLSHTVRGTHPTHTSGETGGLNCLCNSMMILKQTRPFSSFSVSSNENITDKVGCMKQTRQPKLFNTPEVHYITVRTSVRKIVHTTTLTLCHLWHVL